MKVRKNVTRPRGREHAHRVVASCAGRRWGTHSPQEHSARTSSAPSASLKSRQRRSLSYATGSTSRSTEQLRSSPSRTGKVLYLGMGKLGIMCRKIAPPWPAPYTVLFLHAPRCHGLRLMKWGFGVAVSLTAAETAQSAAMLPLL